LIGPGRYRTGALVAATCLTAVCGPAALAAEDKKQGSPAEYSAEIGVGAEYDSNVSVEEVDATSGEGDYALTLDLGLEAKKGFTEKLDAALSYDFSQSFYDEFSEVDRQTHIFGADVAYSAAMVDTGLSTYYIHSRLDGDKFLELVRVSPSLSGFLARKWYARGAYVYSNKSIEERPDRDADTHAGEFDVYFFRRGLRSYFNVGYRYRHEDAEADRYDYTSNSVKIRYIHRWELFSRLSKLELSWRYEDRDYDGITPSIGEERNDERHRWRADLEVPLVGEAAVQLYYGYSDYESNFPSADYTQYLVGTRFLYRW
jgi:hypothetical protein